MDRNDGVSRRSPPPTIVFLVSDDSAYYNGAEIVIDGGLSAHVSHKRIADATRPRLKDPG